MNKLPLLLLVLTSPGLQAQNAADEYYDPHEMAMAREHEKHHNGGQTNYLILAERLERQFHDGNGSLAWEAQGWIGKDLHKFWLKTEGEYDFEASTTEEVQLQALYSRAISPYFDLQTGFRHDYFAGHSLTPGQQPVPVSQHDSSRTHAVLGIQGLAPNWFEVDAAGFLSEEGKLSARLEAEYDLRFTQRLFLQPRLELNYAFSADPERGLGKGMSKAELGLRLRYEVRRELAPYIGVNWESAFSDTADILQQAGEERDQFSVVAGIRFWY